MSQLIDNATLYVSQLMANKLPTICLYHNYTHTKRVFKSTKEIIEHTDLSEEDKEALLLAALFHDTGYINCRDGHEAESVMIATEFLRKQGLEDEFIEKVNKCISATCMTTEPKTEMEKVIRDADASHFAKDYFEEASEFLRLELRLNGSKNYSKNDWRKENIRMLQEDHEYYTDYAKEHWNKKKEQNLSKVIEKQEKKGAKRIQKEEKKAIIKAKLKMENPDRAIQSIFRVTLRNHIKLSDIADTKANILLSVNAIILSIALSNLLPKLDNPSNAYLVVPTLVFLVFTVISMVLSVLATRPNVTRGQFTKEDVKNKKVNLLFFGNFHHMSLENYEWAMNEMLNDREYIYSSLTKDLYFLGLVLNRKYRILRITYTIFIIGIVISVLVFALSFLMSSGL